MFSPNCPATKTTVIEDLARFGPARCDRLAPAEAARYALGVARRGGENFHVLSWLLPRRLRGDLANLYAFCRWADDLADESGDRARASGLLAWWREELGRCFDGRPRHPVFVALRATVERHDLPREPLALLVDAFEQDQRQSDYPTWDSLVDYCRRSANPVGRLYLMVCGYRDEARFRLSDRTCTALQLVNFWQDVRRDALDRGRVYVPRDVAAARGLDPDALRRAIRGGDLAGVDAAYRATVRELADRTARLFARGRALLPLLAPDIRRPVSLFTLGGEAVLRRIVRCDYGTHLRRPRLGPLAKAAVLARGALPHRKEQA
jgi:squalene synthase HpnC